jgi:hypothetical protein
LLGHCDLANQEVRWVWTQKPPRLSLLPLAFQPLPLFDPVYRPVILNWCRRRPVPAADLTQDILLKLFHKFPQPCYDPDDH